MKTKALLAAVLVTLFATGSVEPERVSAMSAPILDVNDASFLWPPPASKAELDALLSADDQANGGLLWPKDAFDSALMLVQSAGVTSSAGSTFTITLPRDLREAFLQPHNWKLVGFRVDPCAPGCDPSIARSIGSAPQLRLVFQPVTASGDLITVHDFAAHVVFNFTQSITGTPFVPDRTAFQPVVNGLVALKRASMDGGVSTDGPLRVHPALAAKVPGLAEKIKGMVKAHVSAKRLFAVAFTGLSKNGPDPWVFFAMTPDGMGRLMPAEQGPLRKTSAQMLTFLSTLEPVVPVPSASNLGANRGVTTEVLFRRERNMAAVLDQPVFPDAPRPLHRDIPNLIANPARTHFFNSDCVSCHSETTRRSVLNISAPDALFDFERPAGTSGVDPANLPSDKWNMRNFGWFQKGGAGRAIAPTITQRTGNEAAEAVNQINQQYLENAGIGAGSSHLEPARQERRMDAVANPLTLVMTIKSKDDYVELKGIIDKLQSLPPDKNPIAVALNQLKTVHFARFVFIEERLLAVITTYDGGFEDYIDAFVNTIGGVFDQLLAHIENAPPLPVADHRREFLDFVRKHDLKGIAPFYSAYPDLTTQDILILQKKSGQ